MSQADHLAANESGGPLPPAGETSEAVHAAPEGWLLTLAEQVQNQIAFSDSKAGLLLTADSILIAGLSTLVTGDSPLIEEFSTSPRVLIGMTFVVLIIAVLLCLLTILPNHRNLWHPATSILNFAYIHKNYKNKDSDKFVKKLLAEGNIAEFYARDIFGKSLFAWRKFATLFFAIGTTGLAIGMAFVAVLIHVAHV